MTVAQLAVARGIAANTRWPPRPGPANAPMIAGTAAAMGVVVLVGWVLGAEGDVLAALSQADVWLSQAKRAGRNQVVGL